MTPFSVNEIETRLASLSKFSLQLIGRNTGVARFYSMRICELREAILAIAKGEIEPLPIYKRNIKQPRLLHHQDIVDAVLELNQANSKN